MTVRPEALARRGERFLTAVAAIDDANRGDPETVVVDGVARPKEQAHAEMACEWVLRLDPDAGDEQLLAARAHHLRRWALPRSDYPDGRAGYLRWRTEQKRRHAALVADILAGVGYEAAVADRVGAIIRKQRLGSDPAVQVHEDALCLVFLATQFGPVARQLGDDRMVGVLVKTLTKMSDRAIAEAQELPLTPEHAALLARAAAGPGS